MSGDYYHQMRRKFAIAVTIVVLLFAGLIYLHVARGRNLELFSVESSIAGLLVALICSFSYLFLLQLRKLEQFNLELSEQQGNLGLKTELLDAASDAIILLDNKGQFIYFNNALLDMSGYSREELSLIHI